jgi:Ca2+-binding EF-hand superfamily protein
VRVRTDSHSLLQIKEAFFAFDTDNDGFLNDADLQSAVEAMTGDKLAETGLRMPHNVVSCSHSA